MAENPRDILVIGGGVVGAGAVMDAASRGLRTDSWTLRTGCMVEIRSMSAIGIATMAISAQSRFINREKRGETTSGVLVNDRGWTVGSPMQALMKSGCRARKY